MHIKKKKDRPFYLQNDTKRKKKENNYSHHVGTKHFKLNEPQNEYCLDELTFTFLL